MKFILFLLMWTMSLNLVGQEIQKDSGLFVNGQSLAHNVCGKISRTHYKLESLAKDIGIEKVEINGDTINFFITYIGGCGYANYDLVTDNRIIETLPPKVYLALTLTDFDYCKTLIHDKVSFDLSPFKNEAKERGIIILIQGTKFNLLYKI